jgi:hypothetical protein
MIAALFILAFTLFSFNSEAASFSVGCYGEDGTRAINGTFSSYELAQDQIDKISVSDPDFNCDIQEEVEEEEQ